MYNGCRTFAACAVDGRDGQSAVAAGREGDGGIGHPSVDEEGGVVERDSVGDRGVDGVACRMRSRLP